MVITRLRSAPSVSMPDISKPSSMDVDLEAQPHTSQRIERFTDWQPRGVQRCLAASSRNVVGLMEDGVTVLKYPHYKSDNAMEALLEEAARHDHLGLHINLVAFKAVHPDGLLFEYCEQGSLYEHIIGHVPIRNTRKIAIGAQVVSGLAHLHQRNYIHCDLNVHNVFITSGGIAKIGDMQGQLYRPDGTIDLPTMSQENAKSRHPEAGDDEFSVKTDIFALGTLLYELWHEAAPFPDLNEQTQEEEIKVRYANGEWPVNVARADPIDMIILRCWTSAYNDVNEILADMESLPENVGK